MEPFGGRLHAAVDDRGPLCVGIDPHPALLAAWGLGDDPGGLSAFVLRVVDALADRAAVVKPQSAFFERHGAAGIAVLERAVGQLRAEGALVLLDVKRGDIGSTMQAYADAYLDPASTLAVDAITVSPYLGFGSLTPALETAALHGGGVFVLARTSNPEGAEVQGARQGEGTVAGDVLARVRQHNTGARPQGSVGVVVAANLDLVEENLDVNGPILAPGYGAQGGTAARLRRHFGGLRGSVLPSSSRQLLAAGPGRERLRDAFARTLEEAASALG